jgi:hypothetical protein
MPARIVTQTTATMSMGDAYRAQIAEWARRLATGSVEELRDAIDGDAAAFERMIAFVDGTYMKRAEWLRTAIEFVAPAFDNLDDLLDDYVNAAPTVAVGANIDDADAFLEWIENTQELTPRQQDYVTCQRARHTVEALALGNRFGHVWFQEVASLATQFAGELNADEGAARILTLHVNPIHTWTTVVTSELLDQECDLPAEVVFFAVDDRINSAQFSPAAADLVRELHVSGPTTLERWGSTHPSIDRTELKQLAMLLGQLGLVAFI